MALRQRETKKKTIKYRWAVFCTKTRFVCFLIKMPADKGSVCIANLIVTNRSKFFGNWRIAENPQYNPYIAVIFFSRNRLPIIRTVRNFGKFHKTKAIQTAVDTIQDQNSIVFLMDLHILVPDTMMELVRKVRPEEPGSVTSYTDTRSTMQCEFITKVPCSVSS